MSQRSCHQPAARSRGHATPLLIQHGDADRIAQIDGSRQFVRSAGVADKQLRVYSGGFHQVRNDPCSDEVTTDLLRWLEARLN